MFLNGVDFGLLQYFFWFVSVQYCDCFLLFVGIDVNKMVFIVGFEEWYFFVYQCVV